MAHALLPDHGMDVAPGRWIPINPETIAALPSAPGIFEIGNLVRTVVQISRAEGDLARAVAQLGGMPAHLPARVGGYYVRFELTPTEEQTLEARLEAYRRSPGGHLPPGNGTPVRIRTTARRAA